MRMGFRLCSSFTAISSFSSLSSGSLVTQREIEFSIWILNLNSQFEFSYWMLKFWISKNNTFSDSGSGFIQKNFFGRDSFETHSSSTLCFSYIARTCFFQKNIHILDGLELLRTILSGVSQTSKTLPCFRDKRKSSTSGRLQMAACPWGTVFEFIRIHLANFIKFGLSNVGLQQVAIEIHISDVRRQYR